MGVKRLLLLTLVTVCYADNTTTAASSTSVVSTTVTTSTSTAASTSQSTPGTVPPTVELNYSPNNNSGVNVTCSAKARPAPVVQLFLWGSNVTANATRTEVNQTDQNLTTVVLTLQLDGINGKDLKCRVLHGNATYIQTLLHTWTWEAFIANGLWYVLSVSLLLTVLVVLFVYCRNQLRDPGSRKRLDCYDPPSRRDYKRLKDPRLTDWDLDYTIP